MKLGVQVGLGPGHIVLDGDPAPPPPKGHSPQFSAHICCSKMAAWIKISLDMEQGICPGDSVLDGDPAPPQKELSQQRSKFAWCSGAVFTRFDKRLYRVYSQLSNRLYNPHWQPVEWTAVRLTGLSNRKRLDVCLHDTAGCTNGCIV